MLKLNKSLVFALMFEAFMSLLTGYTSSLSQAGPFAGLVPLISAVTVRCVLL